MFAWFGFLVSAELLAAMSNRQNSRLKVNVYQLPSTCNVSGPLIIVNGSNERVFNPCDV